MRSRPVPCRSVCSLRELVEREVELQHVHAGLAEEAERALVGVVVDELEHLIDGQAPLLGDTRAPGCGRWRPRCAGRGPTRTRSRRRPAPRRPRRGRCPSRYAATRSLTAVEEVGVGRAQVRAQAQAARRSPCRPRPTGADGSTRGFVNGWPISRSRRPSPSCFDERSFGLVVERHLRDAGDHERVDEPEHDRDEHDHDRARGAVGDASRDPQGRR